MLPTTPPRLSQLILGSTGAVAAAAASLFVLYHRRAMGGHKVRRVLEIPTTTHSVFVGGDLFEVDLPRKYLLSSSSLKDPAIQQMLQAFFTAPFFTLERSLIDVFINRQWPEKIDSKTSFSVGSKHAAWTVINCNDDDSAQLEWGSGKVGGLSNFAVVHTKDDFVTLQFGSKLHSYNHPAFVDELHYRYSKLLLSQTANRLQTMSNEQT